MGNGLDKKAERLFDLRRSTIDREIAYEMVIIGIVIGIFGNIFVVSLDKLFGFPNLESLIISGIVLIIIWVYFKSRIDRVKKETEKVDTTLKELGKNL